MRGIVNHVARKQCYHQCSFPLHMTSKDFAHDVAQLISAVQSLPAVPPFMEGIGKQSNNHMEELLHALQEQSLQAPRNTRAVLTYNHRTFRYKGKSYQLKGEPDFAFLCDVFFALCPKSDKKLHWKVVYDTMPDSYRTDPYSGMEKMRGTIKSLNRWAKKYMGISAILKLERGYVHRVK